MSETPSNHASNHARQPVRPWAHLRAPEADRVRAYATARGWTLTEKETAYFTAAIAGSLAGLDELEDLAEPAVPLRHTWRDPGRRPSAEEDPYNAVIRLCEVRGADEGPLVGRTLGVKDCIAVAGVPMTNGGRRQPTYVPIEDAVVIERLLDAGVTITAKTNLEDLGFGLGEGSAYGPARNPLDPTRSTGGSSSGSGAGVAAGLFDLALGADEAGSVRIPSAWCGLVGMKATHGLVPSYGMAYMSHTFDHIGPITKTVADNALMLEIMAGPDWRDPQWARDAPNGPFDFSSAADAGVAGLRIGVVSEGLGPAGTTDDVREAFTTATKTLAGLGATVTEVSVPLWARGQQIAFATMPAAIAAMVGSHGTGGYQHLGRIDPQLVAVNAAQARSGGDDLPPLLRQMMLVAAHVEETYGGLPFVRAHNLRLELRRQVDAALAEYDVLVMPTIPRVAVPLFTGRVGITEFMSKEGNATANTSPTDQTGHPSLTVPCGTGADGLPVGLQVVGPRYGERLCYQVGFALEAAAG